MLDAALASPSRALAVAAEAARVGDPDATRTVYTTVVVLVVLGVALGALAFWVFRRTRPEPELLSPLETMDTRGWRKLDPAAQRRSLDESRPTGATPLRREASEPALDSSFETVAPVASFDDLTESDGESTSENSTEQDEHAEQAGATDIDDSSSDDDETVESERLVASVDDQVDGGDEDDTAEIPDGQHFGAFDEPSGSPIDPIDPLEAPERASSDREN